MVVPLSRYPHNCILLECARTSMYLRQLTLSPCGRSKLCASSWAQNLASYSSVQYCSCLPTSEMVHPMDRSSFIVCNEIPLSFLLLVRRLPAQTHLLRYQQFSDVLTSTWQEYCSCEATYLYWIVLSTCRANGLHPCKLWFLLVCLWELAPRSYPFLLLLHLDRTASIWSCVVLLHWIN